MKRQRAEISSNVISHIKSAHPIEMWRSNKLGIKEKISRGKFPRLIFSCPVPSGLPHRSHCVPMNMNECVHVISLSFLKKLCSSPMPGAKRKAPPLLRIFHNENPSQRRRPISRRYPPQISTSALPLCLPENRPLDRCPNESESVPC